MLGARSSATRAGLFGEVTATNKRRSIYDAKAQLNWDAPTVAPAEAPTPAQDAPRPVTPAVEEERKDGDGNNDEVAAVVDTSLADGELGEEAQASSDSESGGGELLSEERRALQESARLALEATPSGAPCTATDETNAAFNKTAKTAVEALRANDPSYSVLDLTGNTVFAMKHTEYVQQIADALRTNTYVTEVRLGKCELDASDAKALAAALEVNDTVRVLNVEKNKVRWCARPHLFCVPSLIARRALCRLQTRAPRRWLAGSRPTGGWSS